MLVKVVHPLAGVEHPDPTSGKLSGLQNIRKAKNAPLNELHFVFPNSKNTTSSNKGQNTSSSGISTNVHNVTTTVFWVGEDASSENGFIANSESAWDGQWLQHYGGVDNPNSRNGYYPAGFTPKENPFYFALPYSDFTNAGKRRDTAGSCPNATTMAGKPYSWCKNAWIKITKGTRAAYAQWEDVGPYLEDDVNYVFGSAAPGNTFGSKAGLDVSPAVRDYLGLHDVDSTTWNFVDASTVPIGPWRTITTNSTGYSI